MDQKKPEPLITTWGYSGKCKMPATGKDGVKYDAWSEQRHEFRVYGETMREAAEKMQTIVDAVGFKRTED